MAQIKITHTSNADMNIGVPKQITMAQQTAVKWLLSELQIRLLKIKSEPDGIVRERMINSFLIDAEQAEAMEKEQIQKAFSDGQETPINHHTLPHYSREEYYNETYNK